ncbi:uncharacterized protein LOC123525569 [Mercenaria mercenaria]|uniref:uncharacterized protein LOC123525569 n=1 Tax=Mercenaria mercenaria TaxID=6596 RepID=UPI00234ECABF|nr:uncharacterized protein LOC123525569 [Mercenaria mercenaria]
MSMEVSGRKGATAMSDTVSQSSTEDYDISCQPCSFERNNVGAEGYCQTCSEYLCKTCLNVHRKQSATRNHIILGNDQMPKEQSKSRDVCTKPCSVHVQEIIKFYCTSHDVVGCGDCMVIDHKSCKVDLVENVSSTTDNEKREVRKQIDQFEKDIKKTKKDLISSKQDIVENYSKISQDIAEFRKKINKSLDKMEAAIVLEANEAKKDAESVILHISTELQTLEKDLNYLSTDIKGYSGKHNDLFVSLKETKAKLCYLKMSHAHLKKKNKIQLFEFEKNDNAGIRNLLSGDAVIGMLRIKQDKPQEFPNVPTDRIPVNMLEMAALYVGKIESKDEKYEPKMSGIAVLSADELVATDNRNENVKLVNLKNNEIKFKLPLKSAPFDIACIGTNSVVVTVPKKKLVKVISAMDVILTEQNDILVNGECYGITHFSDGFVISFCRPEKIETIDMRGNVLRSVVFDPSGENLFSRPQYVDICHSTKRIYVSDRTKEEVIVITPEGKLIGKYKEPTYPQGVCVLNDGRYLVAMYVGDINVVSSGCIKQKTLIERKTTLRWAWGICYSYEHKKLFVSYENGRYINVYQLQ